MFADIPPSIWLQYPIVLIILLTIFYLLREFKAFIKERDTNWQTFLKEQRESDQQTTRAVVDEVKKLTEELVGLRKDFDQAVAVMRERTKPASRRTKSEAKAP